jgi:cytochrome c553
MMKRITLMLLPLLLLVACEKELVYEYDDIAKTGDVDRGETLFNESIEDQATCVSCHSLDGSARVGPTIQGYGDVAGDRVDGQDAHEYSFYSIVNPSAHVVQGYSNVMYSDYQDILSEEDIADLIAYMLAQ